MDSNEKLKLTFLYLKIIVERSPKERSLPRLDKTKFLVPQELSMGKFMTIIRYKME